MPSTSLNGVSWDECAVSKTMYYNRKAKGWPHERAWNEPANNAWKNQHQQKSERDKVTSALRKWKRPNFNAL